MDGFKVLRRKKKIDIEKGRQRRLKQLDILHLGHGKSWTRGQLLGKGTETLTFSARASKDSDLPQQLVVKSIHVYDSGSLANEGLVMAILGDCPSILQYLGHEITDAEDGSIVYNNLVEFASGGTIRDQINSLNLPLEKVKCYTRSILEGLEHIHACGFVKCDVKAEKVFLVGDFKAKLGDFGVTKKETVAGLRGDYVYLSPEALNSDRQSFSDDIWALGCLVLEMLTGKVVSDGFESIDSFVNHIKAGNQPHVPAQLPEIAWDFLNRCMALDPLKRSSANDLLSHPFCGGKDVIAE